MKDKRRMILTIVGPEAVMQHLKGNVSVEGVEITDPEPTASMSDAVDAALGPEEIKMLMEFATVGLAFGAATIEFIGALKNVLTKSDEEEKPRIIILDGRTNAKLIAIDADTDPSEAKKILDEASKS